MTTAIDIQPERIDFGRILADAHVERNVNIICSRDVAYCITNVMSTVEQFTATYEKRDENSYYVKIRTVPPLPPGVTHGQVRILSDNSKYAQIDLGVTATVSSDILAVSTEIVLDEGGDRPTPVAKYVAIRSRHKKRFRIVKVRPPEPDIKVEISPLGSYGYCCSLKTSCRFLILMVRI